jgi:hypothetical protein
MINKIYKTFHFQFIGIKVLLKFKKILLILQRKFQLNLFANKTNKS